jgi:perosamine synthetase
MYERKLDTEALTAVLGEVVRSGKLTHHNPVVREFEEMFAGWIGAEYAVACSSGTAALHLILAALGIGKGDRVGVPELTYIATANAVKYVGAEVVPLEVEPGDWNVFAGHPADNLKAVIPVHLLGAPADIGCYARRRDIPLIVEDACEAIGTRLPGGAGPGTRSGAAAFSFFWNKHLTCGEGGMVVSNNITIARTVRSLRNQAADVNYRHSAIGFNYRMTAMQAALGLEQMRHLDETVALHKERWAWYAESLRPQMCRPGSHSGWVFGYQCKAPRNVIRMLLRDAGVETRPMFPMISEQPMYSNPGLAKEHSVAKDISDSVVMLPCHTLLTRQDVDRIVNVILEGEEDERKENRREEDGQSGPHGG